MSITIGADVKKLGLHWVAVAADEHAAACVIHYDFFEFFTAGKPAADCELAIQEGLFAWHEALAAHPFRTTAGEESWADLALIDEGWKEESWNAQPVRLFCRQVGPQFLPSKGLSPYRPPRDATKVVMGDNWHVGFPRGEPLVEMNADHWKLKVHEGFLLPRGEPGSLALFDPPRIDGQVNRTAHLSFAKHILSESWESRFAPGFRGTRTGWWKSPKPNHYFDATYAALVGRSMRGVSVLGAPQLPSQPIAARGRAREEAVDSPGRQRGW